MKLDRVELWINQENIASQRLAHKIGFTRRGHFQQKVPHRSDVQVTLVYGLYRQEWDDTPPSTNSLLPRFAAVEPELAVSNVKAAATYYRDQLGFTIEWMGNDPPAHAIVACREWMATGICIHFQRVPNIPVTTGVVLIITVTSDIEALYTRYMVHGIHIITPITAQPWGQREFEIADLNGYHLRFTAPC